MKKLIFAFALISGVSVNAQVTTPSNSYPTTSYLGSSASSTDKNVYFRSNGLERMRILGTTGTLGINTSTPNSTMGIHMDSKLMLLTGSNSYGGPQIVFGQAVTDGGVWGIEYNYFTAGREGLNFWKPWGSAGASGNFFLFLHNSGRVGINTDNPTAQFTVNGNCLIGTDNTQLPAGYRLYVETGILTEKVKVAVKNTANWADYVFEPTYQRMSLSELESFVTINKHLPNIPSAEEVVADGVDLGEMSSKLLEKIEELTLYIIDQDKRINALQEEVRELNK